MKKPLIAMLAAALLTTLALPVVANWGDFLKQQVEQVTSGSSAGKDSAGSLAAASALSNSEMAEGLKQALQKGVDHAIENLGSRDGFLANPKVKIPMPDYLQQVEQILRKTGQDQYADQFVTSMNRAAEQAVPLTADVLREGVRDLTIEQAKNIVNGPDDAATRYLRQQGGDQLRSRIAPMVAEMTEKVGVTRYYKQLFGNLGFMGNMINPEDYDIDRYVTDKTVDGLFAMLAEQEKLIRENPLERTTDLLKRVFSGH